MLEARINKDLRTGGDNRYIILLETDRHQLLKCVWFCEKEDLGDQIFCTKEGQEIWVAKYHTSRMLFEEAPSWAV